MQALHIVDWYIYEAWTILAHSYMYNLTQQTEKIRKHSRAKYSNMRNILFNQNLFRTLWVGCHKNILKYRLLQVNTFKQISSVSNDSLFLSSSPNHSISFLIAASLSLFLLLPAPSLPLSPRFLSLPLPIPLFSLSIFYQFSLPLFLHSTDPPHYPSCSLVYLIFPIQNMCMVLNIGLL